MRIIKFRVWDEEKKLMFSDFNWYDVRDSKRIIGKESKDFIIMQFTGLLDKNGKEIYEGDIIEYEEIQSDGTRFSNKDRREIKWLGGHFNIITLNLSYWKVIGNIYENPELLKEEMK